MAAAWAKRRVSTRGSGIGSEKRHISSVSGDETYP